MAIRIDGKALATQVKARAAAGAASLARKPGLAVILVGDDPASRVYVTGKEKDCAECGFLSFEHKLPADTTEAELLALIARLNEDPAVDGILVQLPLPGQINEKVVLRSILPEKDVDGFHPVNVGLLSIGDDCYAPATPSGIIAMFKEYGIEIAGKHCVIIGRSNIVGKPMAALLLRHNATVTVCHSKTQNLGELTRQADIVIVATGHRHTLTADMVKEGAVVIDVGMNRNELGKLCGDVDFDEVKEKASFITPVPGGVGPMTITELLENTILAAQRHHS